MNNICCIAIAQCYVLCYKKCNEGECRNGIAQRCLAELLRYTNTYRTSTADSTPMELGMVHGDKDADTDSEALNAFGTRDSRPGGSRTRSNTGRTGNRTFTPRQQLSQQEVSYCQ